MPMDKPEDCLCSYILLDLPLSFLSYWLHMDPHPHLCQHAPTLFWLAYLNWLKPIILHTCPHASWHHTWTIIHYNSKKRIDSHNNSLLCMFTYMTVIPLLQAPGHNSSNEWVEAWWFVKSWQSLKLWSQAVWSFQGISNPWSGRESSRWNVYMPSGSKEKVGK